MSLRSPVDVSAPPVEPSDPRESGSGPQAIRVFVAEDHDITLWGLTQLIRGAQPRMRVVGTAASVPALLTHEALTTTDVLLLDLQLGEEPVAGSALATLTQVTPRLAGQILVLTASDEVDIHRQAVMLGARGVLHKSAPAEAILKAIEKVHQGEIWLKRNLLGDVLRRLTAGTRQAAGREGLSQVPAPGAAVSPRLLASDAAVSVSPRALARQRAQGKYHLTPREREIIAHMVSRVDEKQFAVADALGLSEHTLRNHLSTIYSKLGLHGRLELYVWAQHHGVGGSASPQAGEGAPTA